jgi:hypothetical protein
MFISIEQIIFVTGTSTIGTLCATNSRLIFIHMPKHMLDQFSSVTKLFGTDQALKIVWSHHKSQIQGQCQKFRNSGTNSEIQGQFQVSLTPHQLFNTLPVSKVTKSDTKTPKLV